MSLFSTLALLFSLSAHCLGVNAEANPNLASTLARRQTPDSGTSIAQDFMGLDIPPQCAGPCKALNDTFATCQEDSCICTPAGVNEIVTCLDCFAGLTETVVTEAQSIVDTLVEQCAAEGFTGIGSATITPVPPTGGAAVPTATGTGTGASTTIPPKSTIRPSESGLGPTIPVTSTSSNSGSQTPSTLPAPNAARGWYLNLPAAILAPALAVFAL